MKRSNVNFWLLLMVETLGVEEKWVGPASQVGTRQLTPDFPGRSSGKAGWPPENHLLGEVSSLVLGGNLGMAHGAA